MHKQDSSSFVRTRLPWIVALVSLALYVATINSWLSLVNLPAAGLFTDPQSSTPLSAPLYYLLTLPLRLLPASLRIVGGNAFSAVCACLVLAQLARSVTLLPHDRTREERHRETDPFSLLSGNAAWLPPVIAVLLCGLQLTFWQHATSASGEMLDLLLFAFVLRCLLEYRAGSRESWLYVLSFVYGLATTNNWAFIGFFPLVLTGVLWLRGWQFFQSRFLLRMTALGVAGLGLYLLLPVIATVRGEYGITIWQGLRFELVTQKTMLLLQPFRLVALIAALTSLIPLVISAIRWPSTSGDTSAIGGLIANHLFKFLYPALFLAGLYAATESAFSARGQLARLSPDAPIAGVSFLSFSYLGALATGYFLGYFLLVFGRGEERARHRSSRQGFSLTKPVLAILIAAGCGTAAFLGWTNFLNIRAENSPWLRQFAKQLLEPLPAGGSILLSDNDLVTGVAQAFLAEKDPRSRNLLVATKTLESARYQRQLHERAPHLWPAVPAQIDASSKLRQDLLSSQVATLALSNAVFYLHPSFGYYFEGSYPQPLGLLQSLTPYRTDQTTPPPLPPAVQDEVVRFWAGVAPSLESLEPAIRAQSTTASLVGRLYSLALNQSAVQLQRSGTNRFADAARLFQLSLRLNPKNLLAEVNLAANQKIQQRQPLSGTDTPFLERFARAYRSWDEAMAKDGPVDEPRLCERLGNEVLQRGLHRQASIEFLRAISLDPVSIPARIGLANTYAAVGLNDQVLTGVSEIRKLLAAHPLPPEQQTQVQDQLTQFQAVALHGKGDPAAAEKLLLDAVQQRPDSALLTASLVDFYQATQQPTKALDVASRTIRVAKDPIPWLLAKANLHAQQKQYQEAVVDLRQVLARDPENRQALLHLGAVHIQRKDFTNAIPSLNTLLKLDPEDRAARLNRAIALLQVGQLDAAEKDYKHLLAALPNLHSIQYGLAEIAVRRKQTAKAIGYLEAYLRLAPPDTAEAREVAERLQALKSNPK